VTVWRFSFPTDIRFGVGARRQIVGELRSAGVVRPLVVTDRGVSGLAFMAEILDDLAAGGLQPALFDGVWGNPVSSQVAEGTRAYGAHDADGVLGVGGGAAIDVAKAVALMATHPGELFDYADERPGAPPITDAVPFFVAVPTTAGTGSEVGRSAVIADDSSHVKRIIFSPHLLAKVVFADAELTVGLPPALTAATGMDALTHNIEAYLAKDYNPICDGIALEGLRLCAANLAAAVAAPNDLAARGGMLMASMMGAIAFQKGLGLVHSTAHALGTHADLHHGLANAVMIDHALGFNVESVPHRFAIMAEAVGLDERSPHVFLRWLAELKAEISVPPGPLGADVTARDVDRLARLSYEDGCHLNNPRPVTEEDFRAIFVEALAS
jgi:alcohol dehydrogenase class IV